MANPHPSSQGDAQLLASVLSYLQRKNGGSAGTVSNNALVQAIASAAAGILTTASHGTRFLDEISLTTTLTRWASGSVAANEFEFPQLVAACLLWADTAKNGA